MCYGLRTLRFATRTYLHSLTVSGRVPYCNDMVSAVSPFAKFREWLKAKRMHVGQCIWVGFVGVYSLEHWRHRIVDYLFEIDFKKITSAVGCSCRNKHWLSAYSLSVWEVVVKGSGYSEYRVEFAWCIASIGQRRTCLAPCFEVDMRLIAMTRRDAVLLHAGHANSHDLMPVAFTVLRQ